MPDFAEFLGNTVGEGAAFAAGIAVGPLLAPLLRLLENETWQQYQDMPVPAQLLAQGLAERKPLPLDPDKEAAKTGFGADALETLVDILRTAPSVAEALTLIRRGQMAPTDFQTVLQRAGLEQQWLSAIQALSTTGLQPWEQPLSPADLAVGLVRGNLDPNTVGGADAFPLGGPVANSSVPLDPVSGINVKDEAAASGYSLERMQILARNVGLPPGVMEGLALWNRGDINEDAVNLLIAQSDLRLSWTDAIKKLARMILTPHEYTELYLRGWITRDEMLAGTALHGLTPEDTQLLYDVQGRPLGIHAITTALARGGRFQPQAGGPQDPYDAYVHWSNLRPEMYELAKANAYSYPSLFQLNTLVKAHAITADTAREWAYKQGYATEVLDALHTYWSTFATVTGGKNLTVAQVKAAWKEGQLTDAQVLPRLEADGYSPADAALLLATWKAVPPPLPPTA